MEPLKVGDLVVHSSNEKHVLKIEYFYKDDLQKICEVSSINNPEEKWDVRIDNLTKAPLLTIAEHSSILSSSYSSIIGDLIKIPGYEAFIIIDGKPFQLKKDDNEL